MVSNQNLPPEHSIPQVRLLTEPEESPLLPDSRKKILHGDHMHTISMCVCMCMYNYNASFMKECLPLLSTLMFSGLSFSVLSLLIVLYSEQKILIMPGTAR